MRKEDNITYELGRIYERYGYQSYKVSEFEEYDLYAGNKDFLVSSRILTFNDINGKLMALKPDVTLSIIKNTKDDDKTKKVYYTEHVYRVPHNGYGFREITQTGLECIGDIDTYTICEVIDLAAASLATISDRYILDISDVGIINGILVGIDEDVKGKLLEVIGEKNPHGIRSTCMEEGVSEDIMNILLKLINVYEPIDDALAIIDGIELPYASRQAVEELKKVASMLEMYGIKDHIYVDFSIVNDMTYYNGIFFKGFIEGLAEGILSGGQYDNLLAKLGKKGGAIGFAVYLDQLENLYVEKKKYDADVVISYDDDSDIETVIKTARQFAGDGKSVRVQKDGGCTGKLNISINGREVVLNG